MIKYFEIQDERGTIVGYVCGKDRDDAFDKVLDRFAGCNPDHYLIDEVNKRNIEWYIRRIVKKNGIMEL